MNPLMWIRLGGIAAVLAILTGLCWYVDKGGYDRAKQEDAAATNEAIIKQQQETQKITLAYAVKLTEALENEQRYQTVIADAVNRAERLQVNFPTCPVPGTTGSTTHPDEAGRLAAERLDSAFDRLRKGTEQLIKDCARLNVEAIRSNTLNK